MAARELLGDVYCAREQYTEVRRQYRYIFDRRRHEVEAALKLAKAQAGARVLYDHLHARPSTDEEEPSKPQPAYFDPLDLNEFLALLNIQTRIDKLVAYIERR